MRRARLLQLTFLLAFTLALSAPALAQAPTDSTLTNADIVKAGIPESIILREIQMSETDFRTSATALIELRKQGVSDRILGTMLDSRSGANRPQPQPLPTPHVAAQSAAPGLHQLPSFEVAVRLNSTTKAKVSVSQNHIKVERSGVPLFSLKWKEKRSQ